MGVSRSAGRVARRSIVSALAARRCVCARLIGSAVVIVSASQNQKRPIVLGTKGRAFRGATLIRRVPHFRDRRGGWCHHRGHRRCPVSLALCAGAYWRLRCPLRVRSGGSRGHSSSSSLRLAPTAGSLDRRATGTRPVHSPLIRDVRGVWVGSAETVKARTRFRAWTLFCVRVAIDPGSVPGRQHRAVEEDRSPRLSQGSRLSADFPGTDWPRTVPIPGLRSLVLSHHARVRRRCRWPRKTRRAVGVWPRLGVCRDWVSDRVWCLTASGCLAGRWMSDRVWVSAATGCLPRLGVPLSLDVHFAPRAGRSRRGLVADHV